MDYLLQLCNTCVPVLLGTSRTIEDDVSMCPASGVVLFIGCAVGYTEKYTASTAQSGCVCVGGGVYVVWGVCVRVCVYYTYTSCTGDSHQFWIPYLKVSYSTTCKYYMLLW